MPSCLLSLKFGIISALHYLHLALGSQYSNQCLCPSFLEQHHLQIVSWLAKIQSLCNTGIHAAMHEVVV